MILEKIIEFRFSKNCKYLIAKWNSKILISKISKFANLDIGEIRKFVQIVFQLIKIWYICIALNDQLITLFQSILFYHTRS